MLRLEDKNMVVVAIYKQMGRKIAEALLSPQVLRCRNQTNTCSAKSILSKSRKTGILIDDPSGSLPHSGKSISSGLFIVSEYFLPQVGVKSTDMRLLFFRQQLSVLSYYREFSLNQIFNYFCFFGIHCKLPMELEDNLHYPRWLHRK